MSTVERLRLAEGTFINLMDGKDTLMAQDGTIVAFDGFWVDIEKPGLLTEAADEIERLQVRVELLEALVEHRRIQLETARRIYRCGQL